jgi:hypothetical protein
MVVEGAVDMPAKSGPRGEVRGFDANGSPAAVSVFWKRGATYLRFRGEEHLVHPSNLRRANGFAIEATLVWRLRDAKYHPY